MALFKDFKGGSWQLEKSVQGVLHVARHLLNFGWKNLANFHDRKFMLQQGHIHTKLCISENLCFKRYWYMSHLKFLNMTLSFNHTPNKARLNSIAGAIGILIAQNRAVVNDWVLLREILSENTTIKQLRSSINRHEIAVPVTMAPWAAGETPNPATPSSNPPGSDQSPDQQQLWAWADFNTTEKS